MYTNELVFYLNGKEHRLTDVDPETTLLQFVRSAGFTGAKLGCSEGACGACTVLLSKYNPLTKKVEHKSVNSCLAPLCVADHCAITTIEALGSVEGGLHPIQERIARLHGSQCGFCTPGIVMALYALLRNNPTPSRKEIEENFDGNLCRCTGYRPILDAAKTFAKDKNEPATGGCGGSCACSESGGCPCAADNVNDIADDGTFEEFRTIVSSTDDKMKKKWKNEFDVNMEPGLPELLMKDEIKDLKIEGKRVTFYRPTTLAKLLELKKEFPTAKLIVGNTEVGMETHFKFLKYPIVINIGDIYELSNIEMTEAGIRIGGGVRLNQLRDALEKEIIPSLKDYEGRAYSGMVRMLRYFASTQIRNMASLSGNIMTASPISDMNPILVAMGAVLTFTNPEGETREVNMKDFFKSYRVTDSKPEEVLTAITVPKTEKFEFVNCYKQARRREDDITVCGAAIRTVLKAEGDAWIVEDMDMAFAGMAPITKQALMVKEGLIGRKWDHETIDEGMKLLRKDVPLAPNTPGGCVEYRQALAASFLFKFFVESSLALTELREPSEPLPPTVEEGERSAAMMYERAISRGKQEYDIETGGLQTGSPLHEATAEKKRAPVGNPVIHQSALQQCTGEAQYTDDVVAPANCLESYLVTSTKPHARILSVDPTEALAMEGVVGYFDHKNLPKNGHNKFGAVFKDEEVFATEYVHTVGQLIGIVVATERKIAREAAQKIKIEYEELPAVLSLEESIEKKNFIGPRHKIQDGDVEAALQSADHVIEGEFYVGGQEHFYLECGATIAIPGELNELTLFHATQDTHGSQAEVADILGIPHHKVVCRMKRMGGSFGGREARTIPTAAAVSLAATNLKRPVRINLDRDIDMKMTGQRHAFIAKYRLGINKDGKIQGMDMDLFAKAGHSMDLTQSVMDRALFHADSCYKFPTMRVVGYCCKTNTASNTAFRGFGGPQGMILTEAALEKAATVLNMDLEEIRAANYYKVGENVHYGQDVADCHIDKCINQIKDSMKYEERRKAIDEFNAQNKFRKRGLSLLPVKFGINFTAKFLNQAAALVHCYTDGTVLLTHGGTEMGQGLHTKMIQIAARALQCEVKNVHIAETASDKIARASPTAASASSDLYGMATLIACEKVAKNLEPFRAKMPGASFADLCQAAFFSRVDISAHGFYATPQCGYDFDMEADENVKRGKPFSYFCWGVAASEVEVDVLTGDHQVTRADVLFDVGASLNPVIDIGQVEGAFIQGMGWTTTEELIWGDRDHKWVRPGHLFTQGPSFYKIPSFNDIPQEMNISLLRGVPNPMAVHSSKAVGEPPLYLGSVVFWAIKDAIKAARKDNGDQEYFRFDAPSTVERIRMSCGDKIAESFK